VISNLPFYAVFVLFCKLHNAVAVGCWHCAMAVADHIYYNVLLIFSALLEACLFSHF